MRERQRGSKEAAYWAGRAEQGGGVEECKRGGPGVGRSAGGQTQDLVEVGQDVPLGAVWRGTETDYRCIVAALRPD